MKVDNQNLKAESQQVDKEHYTFSKYMKKARWCSVWHQLDEVLSVNSRSVLEVGPGAGLFKSLAKNYGVDIRTLDIAEDLGPDVLSSATDMPFDDNEIDTICCFQMLEHLPFSLSLKALQEFNRVAEKNIIISLPDAKVAWTYSLYIPKLGQQIFVINKPFQRQKKHVFDGEHHWEINTLGYELPEVLSKFGEKLDKFKLAKTYRVPENPYHRFFVYKAKSVCAS